MTTKTPCRKETPRSGAASRRRDGNHCGLAHWSTWSSMRSLRQPPPAAFCQEIGSSNRNSRRVSASAACPCARRCGSSRVRVSWLMSRTRVSACEASRRSASTISSKRVSRWRQQRRYAPSWPAITAARRCKILNRHVDELELMGARQDAYGFASADTAFHRALCQFSGNEVLCDLWEMLSRQLTIIVGLSTSGKAWPISSKSTGNL